MTDDNDNGNGGDNDADKRPSIWGKIQTRNATIECTVRGAEGETTPDIKDVFNHRIDHLIDKVEDVSEPDERKEIS